MGELASRLMLACHTLHKDLLTTANSNRAYSSVLSFVYITQQSFRTGVSVSSAGTQQPWIGEYPCQLRNTDFALPRLAHVKDFRWTSMKD